MRLMPAKYAAALFDLDNTLWDRSAAILATGTTAPQNRARRASHRFCRGRRGQVSCCSSPTRAVPDVDGYTTVLIRVTGCRQFSIQLADRHFTSMHALAADDQDTGD